MYIGNDDFFVPDPWILNGSLFQVKKMEGDRSLDSEASFDENWHDEYPFDSVLTIQLPRVGRELPLSQATVFVKAGEKLPHVHRKMWNKSKICES
jgi:hypothetical protein